MERKENRKSDIREEREIQKEADKERDWQRKGGEKEKRAKVANVMHGATFLRKESEERL